MAAKKKALSLVTTDGDAGEWDFMFDENFKLLGYWCCNDANWRGEYFNPFMWKLGFEVSTLYYGDLDELDPRVIRMGEVLADYL